MALEVIRHHRLLELFLAETLRDAVGSGARRGGGARARALRGARAADRREARRPHARPARRPDPQRRPATARAPRPTASRACRSGEGGVFVRVSDSDPEMLRYLSERGISPGDRFEVRDRQPFGGPLFVSFGGQRAHASAGGSRARCAWSSTARGCFGVSAQPHGSPATAVARRERTSPQRCPRRSDGARSAPSALEQLPARAGACARRSRCSAPRSSPRSPTWTPATSPPTSRAARSSATCCCGSCWSANLMAMLIQYLSAKLGIVTDHNLPELFRAQLPPPARVGHVGAGGGHGDGDRHRRVRRRRARAQPAVRRAAAHRRA